MEMIFAGLAGAVSFGILGYCVGRDGFIEKQFWTRCVFKGNPPADYKDWNEFLMSKVKCGVTIQASSSEDSQPNP